MISGGVRRQVKDAGGPVATDQAIDRLGVGHIHPKGFAFLIEESRLPSVTLKQIPQVKTILSLISKNDRLRTALGG